MITHRERRKKYKDRELNGHSKLRNFEQGKYYFTYTAEIGKIDRFCVFQYIDGMFRCIFGGKKGAFYDANFIPCKEILCEMSAQIKGFERIFASTSLYTLPVTEW